MVIRSKSDILESRGIYNLCLVSITHPPTKDILWKCPLLAFLDHFSPYLAGSATHFRDTVGSVLLRVPLHVVGPSHRSQGCPSTSGPFSWSETVNVTPLPLPAFLWVCYSKLPAMQDPSSHLHPGFQTQHRDRMPRKCSQLSTACQCNHKRVLGK